MKINCRYLPLIILMICLSIVTTANAQLAPEPFEHDPVLYFGGLTGSMWIGHVKFMTFDYSDTLRVIPDADGEALRVSRVLVDNEDTVVVSRGEGMVIPDAENSTYHVRWVELGRGDATGTMRWNTDRWTVAFDGEWKQWSLNLGRVSDSSFTAALARAVAQFPPVELVGVTYHLVNTAKPLRKSE